MLPAVEKSLAEQKGEISKDWFNSESSIRGEALPLYELVAQRGCYY